MFLLHGIWATEDCHNVFYSGGQVRGKKRRTGRGAAMNRLGRRLCQASGQKFQPAFGG